MPKITIIEFAEGIVGRKLTDFEKETLEKAYECQKRGDRLFIIPARYQGRTFMLSAINMYKKLYPEGKVKI